MTPWLPTMVLLALLVSCASPEPTPDDADATAQQEPGPTRLYLYRFEKGRNTPTKPLPVALDGRPLVELVHDEYVSVQLDPGQHELVVPGKRMRFNIDQSTELYCSISPVLELTVLVWQIRCGTDPDQHSDMQSCARGMLDPDGGWRE
jgi:hypothetical protein